MMRLTACGMFVLALALGGAPAGAQQTQQPPAAHPAAKGARVIGTISTASPGTIVVTGRDGKAITVKTTAGTKIVGRAKGTVTQIAVGDTIRVVADEGQDGTLTATGVQDVAASVGLPVRGRGGERQTQNGQTLVAGTVAQVRDGAVSITSADGSATTVGVPQSARIERLSTLPSGSLAVGARVMVQGTPNQDGSVSALVVLVDGPAAH